MSQSLKYLSQFSHLQSYYNPSLTGYEGSMVRGFVRSQWSGWEDAPKTYFFSSELDLGDLSSDTSEEWGKNALGLNLLTDQYGAFQETELIVSYASRIHLSPQANLRLGAGVNFNTIKLDGNRLSTEQADDPVVSQYLGRFANMSIVDLNLGISVTHPSYYFSYAVQNVNKGRISSGDVFMLRKSSVSIFQGGYRNRINDQLQVVTNVMWRTQDRTSDHFEFNLKVVLLERLWLGGGHRIDYANNIQLGFLMNRLRLGYIYEIPMLKSYLLPSVTHELMLSISIFDKESPVQIW